MKLRTQTSNQGGILVITIVICSLVGMMLAAYLSMVSSQHTFTQRSQVWNNTIPLCEAGVEEAMAHINHSSVTTNFDVNGWRLAGPTRAAGVTNEGYLNGGKYTMHVENVWPPIITVWGTLKQPLSGAEITRAVRVRTRMNQRFPAAVLARGTVSLSGGAGRIDSFNSTNSTDNTLGQYDPAKSTDRAMVGTTLRTYGAIDVGNMAVHGYVATGPGGTPIVGSTGVVGDKNYATTAGNKGTIQTGHWIDDANFYIPPATLPTDFSLVPQPLMTGFYPAGPTGTNYKYLITMDGDYKAPFVTLSSSEKMFVKGRARLLVEGNTSVSGANAQIIIAPDSSLEWYGRGIISLGGGGAFNQGGYAINLSFIALSNAPVTYGGRAQLIGTIYAPISSVTLSGTTDAIGAVTCNNFTLTGGMGIHFDEALKANPKIRFIAASWRELTL